MSREQDADGALQSAARAQAQPPPGWYRDPFAPDPSWGRWWDGTSWTRWAWRYPVAHEAKYPTNWPAWAAGLAPCALCIFAMFNMLPEEPDVGYVSDPIGSPEVALAALYAVAPVMIVLAVIGLRPRYSVRSRVASGGLLAVGLLWALVCALGWMADTFT